MKALWRKQRSVKHLDGQQQSVTILVLKKKKKSKDSKMYMQLPYYFFSIFSTTKKNFIKLKMAVLWPREASLFFRKRKNEAKLKVSSRKKVCTST